MAQFGKTVRTVITHSNITIVGRRIRLCVGLLVLGIAVAAAVPDTLFLSERGRWVLMPDGEPAAFDEFQRGLQTSGLAWDGKLLWSVGDQRATFPGHIYAIDPQSGRLDCSPIPLVAFDSEIRMRLDAWSRLDLEDIAIISQRERRFVAVLEDKATAALILQVDELRHTATVCGIWEFQFPDDLIPTPYRNDTNYRLEGIAFDELKSRGYVAFERDSQGIPRLYQFHPATLSQSGIVRVRLEPVAFAGWSQLTGKRGAMLNANALQFLRTPSGASRLLVLCRDRELIFVMDPDTGQLIGQTTLKLLSPEGQTIEWVSPEGIAYEPGSGIIYVISDPDSTDGNYRLRSTSSAQGRFAQFVPLLFQFKVPDELLR